MKPRSKLITKVIVCALVVYAGVSLFTLRGRIDEMRAEEYDVRRAVAEQEIINAQLEYDILNYDDSEVRESLARTNLGLVMPTEIVLFDGGSGLDFED